MLCDRNGDLRTQGRGLVTHAKGSRSREIEGRTQPAF